MATYAITFAGASKYILSGTLSIQESANGRNTLRCSVPSFDGTYRPTLGSEIVVTEDVGAGAVTIFRGTLENLTEEGFGGLGLAPITTKVTASDYSAIADHRYVTGTIPAGNLKAALQWLVDNYLTDYSITVHAGQVNGPDLPELPYSARKLSDVLDELSAMTNFEYVWDIDYDKCLVMRHIDIATNPAPFNIAHDDGHVIGDIVVEPSFSSHANRITVRFSSAATKAYAFLGTSDNFADGETVTLGGTTYTFKNVLGAANHVKIGANANESLEHLSLAITVSGVEGTDYGTGTVANGSAEAWMRFSDQLQARALEAGASGNSISVATSNPDAAWYSEGGIGTATLTFGSDAALTNYVTVNDLADQAIWGIRENIYDKEDVFSEEVADSWADAFLARDLLTPKTIRYLTDEVGIHPGMVQNVVEPLRNLNGNFLITDVDISENPVPYVRRRVTAVEASILTYRWLDDAEKLFGGSSGSTSGSGNVVVSGGGTTISGPSSLGGSRSGGFKSAAYQNIVMFRTFTCKVGGAYTFRVEVMTADAGTNITCQLYDVSAGAVVSGSETTPATDTTWVVREQTVTLIAGHRYQAQIKGSDAETDVYCGQAEVEP